jgi:hypothetical protein
MPWVDLQHSLGDRARVIAGPVLRRVTDRSVTVWLAMRVGATVTLTVLDPQGTPVLTNTTPQRSVALGRNLHIIAVTATVTSPVLTEGVVYRYSLSFVFDDKSPGTMAAATNGASLAYAPWDLPSFALPPKDLTRLRLFQGSCRMPHADGPDAFAIVDEQIAATAGNGFDRPHQLLLAGDQIYSDDVSVILLQMLVDASTALLGWTEVMPLPAEIAGAVTDAAQIPSFVRGQMMRIQGFTSDVPESHLMSFGEYLAMYLFCWSPELWPRANMPEFDDIQHDLFAKQKALAGQSPPPKLAEFTKIPIDYIRKINDTRDNLETFRQTLPAVRRALANIPTYMIFDDHEITDDWNMTRDIVHEVYGKQFGLRVIQNGVLAYVFCQHWGNVPEDLAPGPTVTPGNTLVPLVDTPNPTAPGAFAQKATDYTGLSPQIRGLIGLHNWFAIDARVEHAIFHDPISLTYNYSIVGPAHQVIVTDTRTWRAFPTDSDGKTHLLTKTSETDQFAAQIGKAPDPGDRQLLVVVTTNIPPVQPIRSAEANEKIANAFEFFPDLYESWNLPSISFDRMLTAITGKLPRTIRNDGTQSRNGSVILLSGDVHFSFATRLIYRASNAFEAEFDQSINAVVAQLVNSSMHKQSEDTLAFHRDGYFLNTVFFKDSKIRHARTEGYAGFNFPKGSGITVGRRQPDDEKIVADPLTTVDVTPKFTDVKLFLQPHYQYRLDYLLPTGQSFQFPKPSVTPLPGGPPTAEQRKLAARTFADASKAYRSIKAKDTPQLVGVNNIGEIRFEGTTAATRTAKHIVRWKEPSPNVTAATVSTTYTVQLDVNSPDYPDIPVTVVKP